MSQARKQYWFPAKRYGWGWGPPNCWQGWAVMVAHLVVVFWSIFVALRTGNWLVFYAVLAVSTVLLLLICWWRGEPPRWRWDEN